MLNFIFIFNVFNATSLFCLFTGSKWAKRDLTYKIQQVTPRLPRLKVEREIARAFKVKALFYSDSIRNLLRCVVYVFIRLH